MKINYSYEVNLGDFGFSDLYFYKMSNGIIDMEKIAEEAAKDYYCFFDGWKKDWPLTFIIYKDGEFFGKFLIYDEKTNFRAVEQWT